LSTFDFEFVPYISAGKILFLAHLYESMGSDKSGILLAEDKNLARVVLKEQGPIINSWDMAGEGTDWGDDRLTSNALDDASRVEFGLRESSAVFGDVKTQETLDAHGATNLSNTKDPTNLFTLNALDDEPAGFEDYGLGDVVSLLAPSYGFGGTSALIRIMSREFSPKSGRCSLVVQEQF
jgi:hypothetical protein